MASAGDILRRNRTGIVLAVVLLLAVSGLFDRGFDALGGARLRAHNAEYLDACFTRAVRLLVPIGVVKGTVDVMEGSRVAGIEFGDAMQPMLDYINLAWNTVLGAAVVLLATKYILQGTAEAGQIALISALVAYGLLEMAQRVVPRWRVLLHPLRQLAAMLLVTALLFYLVLPVSMFGAATLSEHTTQPLETEYRNTFTRLQKVFSLHGVGEVEGMRAKAERMAEHADAIVQHVQSDHAEPVLVAVIYVVIVHLLDALVFPLAMLLFLVWFVRRALWPSLQEPSVVGAA